MARAAHVRFLVVSGVLAAGLAPLPLAGSMPVFAVLVIVAGLGLAPSTAAGYSLIGELAPEGAITEAYAWQIVGYVGGSAAGAWLAGVVVEAGRRDDGARVRAGRRGARAADRLGGPALAPDLTQPPSTFARLYWGTSTTFPTLRCSARIRCASGARSNGHRLGDDGLDRAVLHQLDQRVDPWLRASPRGPRA